MDLNGSYEFSFRFIIKFFLVAIALVLIVLFVTFQARYLIVGPQIVITSEPTGPQNERQVYIAGTAYNISRLWLNDRPIYTDAQGNFKEALILENGYTIVTLRAEDRYGRTEIVTRPLVYAPASFIK